MTSVDTYFIRHSKSLDVSQTTRDRLWNERLIAIHYPEDLRGAWREKGDNESIDPSDYVRHAKKYMGALRRLANDGGYVCAEYFGHSELLIGKVSPHSQVTILRGEWGSSSRPAVLKTVQLSDVKTLDPRKHSVVAVKRPRQGTISKWHAVGEVVGALIDNRQLPLSWNLLRDNRQEVACSEFLRLPEASQFGLPRLQSLLLPVGRTLKDVDIIGIATDGKQIFAQVTVSALHHAGGKFDKLRKFIMPEKSHVILFCECDAPSIQDGIQIFPVSEVFKTLNGLEWGQQFLRGIS